jgi:hypothetical protein
LCDDGNKITQQSAMKEDGTATTVIIPTMEGRRGWGAEQGASKGVCVLVLQSQRVVFC